MPPPSYNSQYQDAGQAISGLGDSINNIVLGVAQQKWRQQLQQQQFELKRQEMLQQERLINAHVKSYETQAALEAAQAALARSKTTEQTQETGAKGALGHDLWNLGMLQASKNAGIDMGPRNDIGIARALESMAQLPDSARSKLPLNIAEMFQVQKPGMQELMATGTKSVVPIGAQGGAYLPLTGQISSIMPQHLTAGSGLYPGTGGEALASAPFNPAQKEIDWSRMLGSIANIRGQGINTRFGEPTNPEDPTFKMATEAAQQLIPFMLGKATNAPTAKTIKAPGAAPAIGEIKRGYRFKGGEPNNPDSWEKVQ